MTRCWFADRMIRVRQKYGLTIDQRKVDALDSVLSGCESVEMIVPTFPRPRKRQRHREQRGMHWNCETTTGTDA